MHKTLFQSTVDIHFQNAHKTHKTAKARTLCIYYFILAHYKNSFERSQQIEPDTYVAEVIEDRFVTLPFQSRPLEPGGITEINCQREHVRQGKDVVGNSSMKNTRGELVTDESENQRGME